MSRNISKPLVILISLCLLVQVPLAQDAIKLTDRQWIELSIDMIRKAVQQQDATKVLKIFAPQVRIPEGNALSKNSLGMKLEEIFSNSSDRSITLSKPVPTRDDNPLIASNFWDFDILTPHIDIRGDSAFVECELVLWGSRPDSGTDRPGKHTVVSLVFFSPKYSKASPPLTRVRPLGIQWNAVTVPGNWYQSDNYWVFLRNPWFLRRLKIQIKRGERSDASERHKMQTCFFSPCDLHRHPRTRM